MSRVIDDLTLIERARRGDHASYGQLVERYKDAIYRLAYRILRHHVPGPYTFILPATREVPRIVQTNAQTVGIRVPKSHVCTALINVPSRSCASSTSSAPSISWPGCRNVWASIFATLRPRASLALPS